MTSVEFEPIAGRISALWPPALNAAALNAYFEVLEGLDAEDVRQAVRVIAQTPREKRPPAGLIHDTALRLSDSRPAAQLPAASSVDPLSPDEHRIVLAMNWRLMSEEKRRRCEAVKPLVGQVPWIEMLGLMRLSPADFDAVVARKKSELTGRLV